MMSSRISACSEEVEFNGVETTFGLALHKQARKSTSAKFENILQAAFSAQSRDRLAGWDLDCKYDTSYHLFVGV